MIIDTQKGRISNITTGEWEQKKPKKQPKWAPDIMISLESSFFVWNRLVMLYTYTVEQMENWMTNPWMVHV